MNFACAYDDMICEQQISAISLPRTLAGYIPIANR